MRTAAIASLVGLVACAARADIIFNFEDLTGNSDRDAGDFTVLNVESDGLFGLITRTSGERFTVWNSNGEEVPEEWGRKHLSPTFNLTADDYLVMSFSQPLSRVTVEFGDFGQDHDLAEVYAFDDLLGEGNVIDEIFGEMGDSDMREDDPTRLTVEASEGELIWSIKFRGGEDPFYQSTFIDNILVEVVPSPGTLAVLGLACAAAAGRLRRRDPR